MLNRLLYRLFGKLPKTGVNEFLKPYREQYEAQVTKRIITHQVKQATL